MYSNAQTNRDLISAVNNPSCIICCTPFFGDDWTWLVQKLDGNQRQWYFHHDKPHGPIEKLIRQPNIAMIRSCLQAVQSAKQHHANLLVTHDPRVSFWCAFFSALLGMKIEHLAYSFNFPDLPKGIKYLLMKWVFSNISQFTVYSKVEKQIYSKYFGIPVERFKVLLWGVATPTVQPEEPLETGDYICAIGGNARDYQTLMAAMEKLPDIPMVAVVRPHNLKNLSVPPNVKVSANLPFAHTMNILKHSRFMVLPLNSSNVPCGHVTLVAAMHLGKAFIVTNSKGVSDYAFHNTNAITCEPFDPDALAEAIRTLWNHPERCQRLGENGKDFAEEYCSEESAQSYLQQMLISRGL